MASLSVVFYNFSIQLMWLVAGGWGTEAGRPRQPPVGLEVQVVVVVLVVVALIGSVT